MIWIRPKEHCGMGTYGHQMPMPSMNRVAGIDICIADIVAALNAGAVDTIASCCGHGRKGGGSILLKDGRELLVKFPADWMNQQQEPNNGE